MLVALFAAFPVSLALGNVLMTLVLVLWLISGHWRERWASWRGNPVAWIAAALYLWMLLGVLYTPAPWADVQQHLQKYFKLLFMLVVISLMTSDEWRRRALWAYAAALMFILISTYFNIWWQLPWSRTQNQGWGQDHTVVKDYIAQGLLMSMAVLLALGGAMYRGWSKWSRSVCLVLACAGLLSITHLSAGRTGYLCVLAVLGAFALFAVGGRVRLWLLASVFVISAGLYLSSSAMQERVAQAVAEARSHDSGNLELTSIGQRMYFAEKTWGLIQERPWLGWGTGAYHEQFCRVADTETWCEAGRFHPHNQFLFIWVEHGVVGLALLLALMAAPLYAVFNQTGPRAIVYAGFSGLFVVGSMTHGSLWLSTESHLFTLMGALLASAPWSQQSCSQGRPACGLGKR